MIGWMAPELLDPKRYGYIKGAQRKLPSMSTDIYAFGMTILEARVRSYRCHVTQLYLCRWWLVGEPSWMSPGMYLGVGSSLSDLQWGFQTRYGR